MVPAHLTVLPHNLRAQHLPSIRLCTYYPIRIPIPSALRRLRTCRALLPATPALFSNSAWPSVTDVTTLVRSTILDMFVPKPETSENVAPAPAPVNDPEQVRLNDFRAQMARLGIGNDSK